MKLLYVWFLKLRKKNSCDIWQISLCGVIMKLVTNCIAKRVKFWLNNIICETQNTFVLGRLTIYNGTSGIWGYFFNSIKKKGKKGLMTFKLDMFKDRSGVYLRKCCFLLIFQQILLISNKLIFKNASSMQLLN